MPTLADAVLVNAEVHRCPQCGEWTVGMGRGGELSTLVAQAIATSSHRMSGVELRFLRSFLGLESKALADTMGSNPSTVTRWERGHQPIGGHADKLLRALVLLKIGAPTDPGAFAGYGMKQGTRQLLRLEIRDGRWSRVARPTDVVDAREPRNKRATRSSPRDRKRQPGAERNVGPERFRGK